MNRIMGVCVLVTFLLTVPSASQTRISATMTVGVELVRQEPQPTPQLILLDHDNDPTTPLQWVEVVNYQ